MILRSLFNVFFEKFFKRSNELRFIHDFLQTTSWDIIERDLFGYFTEIYLEPATKIDIRMRKTDFYL
jgi:hypothetical protein